jgi:hypothetical protein
MSRDEQAKERNFVFGGSAIFRRTFAADGGLTTGSRPGGPASIGEAFDALPSQASSTIAGNCVFSGAASALSQH